jgi:hypothetical protein
MSEPTSSTTDQTTDDRARTWAFTALGLGLAALMGGGILSNAVQTILLDQPNFVTSRWTFTLAVTGPPFVLGALAMWLGSNAVASDDSLARPVGRAAQTISGIAILGAVLVLVATATRSM